MKKIYFIILLAFVALSINAQVWIVYNTNNSGLPVDAVNTIQIDNNNVKWIGTFNFPTDGGLVKFDNGNWTTYSDTNSILTNNRITEIEIGNGKDIFLSEGNTGLLFFDHTNWKKFTTINSGLLCNNVYAIHRDKDNNYWISTCEGLNKLDDTTWVSFPRTDYPTSDIDYIRSNSMGNIWMARGCAGLTLYDGLIG